MSSPRTIVLTRSVKPRILSVLSLIATVAVILGYPIDTASLGAGSYSNSADVTQIARSDTNSVELGLRFTSSAAGQVVGVRFYKGADQSGQYPVALWTGQGTRLAQTGKSLPSGVGWQSVNFASPVSISPNQTLVASYHAPNGSYGYSQDTFASGRTVTAGAITGTAGVFKYGSSPTFPRSTYRYSSYYVEPIFVAAKAPQTPTTSSTSMTAPKPRPSVTRTKPATSTTTPTSSTSTTPTTPTTPKPSTSTTTQAPSTSGWPSEQNTGVPAGTALSAYTGPCTITTANTVIDAKRIACDLVVQATGVKVTRSQIIGLIRSTTGGSISISDTYIDGGQQETFPAVGQENITLDRVNVVGGQHSVQCYANCVVRDSYLHAQAQPADYGHVNAFITNGGSNFTLVHNTLACTVVPTGKGGGCTADASLFGDFGAVSHATLEQNLFRANNDGAGYCLQAGYNPGKSYPNSTYVIVKNNVFEAGGNGKCGIWGPVTAYNSSATGNVWSGNTWMTTGQAINP